MDTNLSPQRYTCIALDIFKFKIILFKSMQNRALKTAAHHFFLCIRFTAALSVEPHDLFIILRILSFHVSSVASQDTATK
jgi:hypothetical protein